MHCLTVIRSARTSARVRNVELNEFATVGASVQPGRVAPGVSPSDVAGTTIPRAAVAHDGGNTSRDDRRPMSEHAHQVSERIGPGSVSVTRTGSRTYEGLNERGATVRIGGS